MKMRVISLLFLLFGASVSSLSGIPGLSMIDSFPIDTVTVLPQSTVTYKTIDSVSLDMEIYYPPRVKAGRKYPVIVFFFGGGWNGGSIDQFRHHARHFALRDMIAVRADYRVRSRQGTTPFEAVKDARSAIRFLRQHADLMQLDPEKIVASGGSAGGHLAAAAGNLPGLEEEGEDQSVSSKPNALVLFNPVFDNGPDGYGYNRIGEKYMEISPLHNIREGAPPTIVFLGTDDRIIPVSTAQEYKAKMEAVGSRCDLHLYEGQGHGFFNYKQTDNYRNTLMKADRFLVSLGYIEKEISFPQDNSRSGLFESVFISEKMRVLRLAEVYRDATPLSVTAWTCERSAGGPNDFYSEGDYWWPDPDDPGAPYIRKDGLSNPENFSHHRHAMIRMSRIVGTMAGAYLATGDDRYVEKAMEHLRVWFITQQTRMNPNMQYAQAIQGRHTGRGIGIIDAIHLVEPALAILAMEDSPAVSEEELYTMKQWFRDFLAWISTHEYGQKEMSHPNNHGTCWALQAAAYALLVDDPGMLDFCADRYREVLLPDQMAGNGSFPLELKRTKPYGYSIFNLDAMSSLVQVLSLAGIDLFPYAAGEGKSLHNGTAFLYPYITDKQNWPYPEDVLYHDQYPVKQAFLLFGGIAFSDPEYINTWQELESDPKHPEVTRNTIVKNPLLWLGKKVPGKSRMLHNPVIPGFHPDPSICRVGEDFYCVTSSFEYFPGVPVYHSKDLINWTQIGHVLDRPSQLNLDGAACSRGIFAPTIRYDNGTYYMVTTVRGKEPPHRGFIVTANDPAGPWSEPHFIKGAEGIDPSLFFDDDGKVYYHGNCHPDVRQWRSHRQIWIQEMDPESFTLKGERKIALDAADYHGKFGAYSLSAFEAPHIYKKDGWYYLVMAHGGTGYGHCVSVFRSRDVFGPYADHPGNPMLTNSDLPEDFPIACTGHADFFQDQEGAWWLTCLATRPYGGDFYNLGRETFIAPLSWEGAWPETRDGSGRLERSYVIDSGIDEKVVSSEPKEKVVFKDDFNDTALDFEWNFIRTPRGDFWRIHKGKLELELKPEQIIQRVNPAFVGRRQAHKEMEAAFCMDFTPKNESECAGMVLIRDTEYQVRMVVSLENDRRVVRLIKRAEHSGGESILASREVDGNEIRLKVEARGQEYSFLFAEKDAPWQILYADMDGRFLSRKWAGGFTGIYIGMYASSNGTNSRNSALFDWFEYQGKNVF